MNRNHYAPGKVNPHLPHDGVELEPASIDTDAAREEADLLVSQLLNGNSKPSKPAARRASAKNHAAQGTAAEAKPHQSPSRASVAKSTAAAKAPVELRDEADIKKELREAFPRLTKEKEPTPTFFDRFPPVYFVALACGAAVFFWPALLVWILVLAVAVPVSLAALVKIPGVNAAFARGWQRFASRTPARAEAVRKSADRVAMGVERILDMLPGSLADRLSLPDFSQPVAPKR